MNSLPSRRRGFQGGEKAMTLAEIIVVSVLMIILTYCLYSTLLPGVRAWRKSDIRADVQQNALIVLQRVSTELRSSDIDSVVIKEQTCTESGTGRTLPCCAIIFLSPVGAKNEPLYDVNSGQIIWRKHAVFYLDTATSTLRMQEIYLSQATTERPEEQMKEFTPQPSADRVVARHVKAVSFRADQDTDKEGDFRKNPVYFSVTVSIPPYEGTYESAVSTMHNSD